MQGLAGMTGTPILEDAHLIHVNLSDFYLDTVEGALDPSYKWRRPGTKRRSDRFCNRVASGQILEKRTTEIKSKNQKTKISGYIQMILHNIRIATH